MKRALLSAAVLVLLATPARAQAPVIDDLVGLWRTPGGNVIEIAKRAGGAVTGTFVHLTRDSQTSGFKLGDTVLKQIAIEGGLVRGSVAVRGKESGLPQQFVEFKDGQLTAVALTGKLRDGDYVKGQYVEQDGYVDVTYTREGQIVSLRYIREADDTPIPDGGALKYGERFYIEAQFDAALPVAQRTVTVEWPGGSSRPILVHQRREDKRVFRSGPLCLDRPAIPGERQDAFCTP